MTTTHPVSPEEVMAFFDGELDAARAADVATHIQSCATCQQIGHEISDVGRKLDGWTVPPAPGSFTAPASPAQPWLGPMAKLGLIPAASVVVVLAASQGGWWQTGDGGGHAEHRGGGRGAVPLNLEHVGEAWFQQPRDSRFQIPGIPAAIQIFIDWLCQACTAYNKSYSEVVARYEREQPDA